MRTSQARSLATLAITLILLTACNFPRADGTAVSGPDLVLTYAAETVQAQLTLAATGLQPTLTPGLPGTTPTPAPAGETPTTSPGTAETPTPGTGTPAAGVCDRGDFVEDVTFPDNSEVEPGQQFTKTWLLRNDGTCTWNTSYAIVFESGEAMGAPASVPLPGTVAPGDEVEVSVPLTAPQEEGTYQGFWLLRNQAGQTFGLGSDGDEEFWVRVEVVSEDDGGDVAQDTYDFIARASSAEWVGSGQGEFIDLDFGGADDDPNGVAKIIENVRLENGVTAGKTLLMRPRNMHNGGISGTFEEFRVEEGNVFIARIGFVENCGEAQVEFQLWYEEDSELEMLREWEKSCNGNLQLVEVDLSDLDGMRVKFILVVLADGSPEGDMAVWSSPRIELD